MLKIITTLCIFCVLALRVHGQKDDKKKKIDKPSAFRDEAHANQLLDRHLVNMTRAFCKDTTLKLRMAERVQAPYRATKGYELGIIASSLIEKYRLMIRIYRYYSNAKNFRNNDHSIEEIMDGYSNMQGTYNELIGETVVYHNVLDYHMKKDSRDFSEARMLARKYKMSINALLELQRRGIKLSDVGLVRRFMQTDTKLPVNVGKLPEDYKPRDLLLEDPMAKNINIWSPKKNNNSQEEEYKKKLRYIKWAQSWKGYDGETEGVEIADTIARLGFANDSDFLMKELKGVV